MTIIPSLAHYNIGNPIHQSDRTLVYRARRKDNGQSVIIKLMRKEYPSFNELVQFRNQYSMTKNLDIEGIVKPYALERYDNRYALIMEDIGDISLKEYAQKKPPFPIAKFLYIAIQLAEILYQLHQSNIIHKDIKPANILIHPQTQQVKLIDFSISSLLPKETQILQTPNILEGTLAYLSPEQTGRMNRGVDYRSDFYSLGVTFYELLTGRLPFESDDPMELIYAHIAKIPPTPDSRLPTPLVNIIMKLMAKNAEDRYQSALGLKFDLEKCLAQWQETGEIQSFVLGERDICDRFVIPEKLYGRDKEVQSLLDAFNRVSEGKSELFLVAGYSGVGKTAVVNEVHKPIAAKRGYFIKGKFDQFQRNIPFSAFVQTFRDLIAQLLGESDTQLQQWKTKILAALGDSGQVIIEVIPELEKIIGEQPPVPELSGNAAQNRFNLLLQEFVGVFTRSEHPLTIFLDDLQWADSASLKLIELLMSESDSGYLLALGAYRDNEVFPSHPLVLTLEEISKNQVTIEKITLKPLSPNQVNTWIADTLLCELEQAKPLGDLTFQETKGNPFFISQFLKGLHEDSFLTFNIEQRYWQYNLAQMQELILTEDVVKFTIGRLQKFSAETREVLKLAACIGNQFDLEILAIVGKRSPEEIATDLWPALAEGLILPQNETYKVYLGDLDSALKTQHSTLRYKFLHDRIQQAAYSLIEEEKKPLFHYTLGKLLIDSISEAELQEMIFDVVGHLNKGAFQITIVEELLQVCQLNLIAGQKAKLSVAYQASVDFLSQGIKLLPAQSWETNYDLTFSLYKEYLECQYLAGNVSEAEKVIDTLFNHAKSRLDKASIHAIQLIQYQNIALYEPGIKVGLESLKMFALELPEHPDPETIQAAAKKVEQSLGDREVSILEHLPLMENPDRQMMVMLLINMIPPTYITNQDLMVLVILEMTNLCLQYGNTPLSGFVYLWYGTVLCSVFAEYEKGDRFGELGLHLNEQANIFAIKGKVYMTFGSFLSHWRRPLKEGIKWIKASFQPALEAGELSWCFHGGSFTFWKKFLVYDNLESLFNEQNNLFKFSEKKEPPAALAIAIQQQVVLNLQGKIPQKFSLDDAEFQEDNALKMFTETQYLFGLSTYYFAKSFLYFLYGDYQTAYELGVTAEKTHASLYSQFQLILHDFYQALSIAQIYTQASQSEWLEKLVKYNHQFQIWAENCPENYLGFSLLLKAEIARINQNYGQAMQDYDRAIRLFQECKYLQLEALANELAAIFYLTWKKEKVAASYMQDAYYCYSQWGAKAKTDDLEQRYPHLLQPILQQEPNLNLLETLASLAAPNISMHATSSTKNHSSSAASDLNNILDFASVLKASQAISSTIQLDKLLHQLTQIILQYSGADRCILLFPDDRQWQVKAIATPDSIELLTESFETYPYLPVKLIQYVKNTREIVLIDRHQTDLPIIDNYLQQHQPQSVLCLPILHQGDLTGILYLQNQTIAEIFNSDRLLILNFLCTQAAISWQNAQLYQQAQLALTDLQNAQLQIVQSEKMSALGNLMAGVAHEINNPLGFIMGNLMEAKMSLQDVIEHLNLYRKNFSITPPIEDHAEEIEIEYLLEDLPKMIDSMTMGCDRIKNISISLRNFARTDKNTKVSFDIHEGINSTITILKHRLKANEEHPEIKIIKKYDNVPPIQCFPGQLNQVFMNILANAIDAFDEANQGKSYPEIEANPNTITIATIALDQQVQVQIQDNGCGMKPETIERIFEQGFTTKEVGKGTGLGMAIAHQIIVEKHGGAIACHSQLGKGTEFIISLPAI
ncbi:MULTISPECIES: ATP-binding sensor histidine kinase [Spirulina sp. CCY15215]|uniref:trifunctional serine/threonine-protein kinase/ATP-binding protein/sensor histidine kinase n=1 Tax=Spirulina sp. CCY15215 TaxID=2767591 RepID=UPI001950E184|nr:ATP-binding sensor histidine kinase [Spirulina major]